MGVSGNICVCVRERYYLSISLHPTPFPQVTLWMPALQDTKGSRWKEMLLVCQSDTPNSVPGGQGTFKHKIREELKLEVGGGNWQKLPLLLANVFHGIQANI